MFSIYRENNSEFTKAKIPDWWNKSYTGKNVNIAICDDVFLPFDSTKVICPLNDSIPVVKDLFYHKPDVCSVIRQVAPESNLFGFNWFGNSENCVKWLEDHKFEIDLINFSLYQPETSYAIDLYDRIRKLNIPTLCASGNHSQKNSIDFPASLPWTISVGAYDDYYKDIASYSNGFVTLDCVGFAPIYVPKADGKYVDFPGTSAATAFNTGLLALYIQWRKEKHLQKLTNSLVRKFIYKNCHDILNKKYVGTKGKDNMGGHGILLLPNAEEIDYRVDMTREELISNGLSVKRAYSQYLFEGWWN
jgi:hypothetical protein